MNQLTAADLAHMSHAEIDQARIDGRLDVLLGVPPDEVALLDRARTGRITIADVTELNRIRRHDLVNAASDENRIDLPTEG